MTSESDPYGDLAPKTDGPLAGVRRLIAKRLGDAHRETVPVTLHREIRASLTGGRPYDNLVHAVVQALAETPALNAVYEDGRLRTFAAVNLGLAFEGPQGLVVPVVRHAESLDARDLKRVRTATAFKVKSRGLAMDDVIGGTFTISNLGTMGVQYFTPIINPPQVAILGVGAQRPLLDSVDIPVSLTFDHRVVDGAAAARFLDVVQGHVLALSKEMVRHG